MSRQTGPDVATEQGRLAPVMVETLQEDSIGA
jgi:hypothetical protein